MLDLNDLEDVIARRVAAWVKEEVWKFKNSLKITPIAVGVISFVLSGCPAFRSDETTTTGTRHSRGECNWGPWGTTSEPTCTTKGSKSRFIICDEGVCIDEQTIDIDETECTPACDHNGKPGCEHTTTHTVTHDATCQVPGSVKTFCADPSCQALISEETLTNQNAHTWGAWYDNPAATCTTNGQKVRNCTVNNCTVTETGTVINAHGHGTDNCAHHQCADPNCVDPYASTWLAQNETCTAQHAECTDGFLGTTWGGGNDRACWNRTFRSSLGGGGLSSQTDNPVFWQEIYKAWLARPDRRQFDKITNTQLLGSEVAQYNAFMEHMGMPWPEGLYPCFLPKDIAAARAAIANQQQNQLGQ